MYLAPLDNSSVCLQVVAIVMEMYLIAINETYFSSSIWLTLVGYVGANHFLYGLHNLAGTSGAFSEEDCQLLNDLSGVGGMLKQEEKTGSWTRFLWNFSEHRYSSAPFHPAR